MDVTQDHLAELAAVTSRYSDVLPLKWYRVLVWCADNCWQPWDGKLEAREEEERGGVNPKNAALVAFDRWRFICGACGWLFLNKERGMNEPEPRCI